MKKLIITLLFLVLGITVYFDAESNFGYVYVNDVTHNTTAIAYPSSNMVYLYGDDGSSMKITYSQFNEFYKKKRIGTVEHSVAIILPTLKEAPKEAPKIPF